MATKKQFSTKYEKNQPTYSDLAFYEKGKKYSPAYEFPPVFCNGANYTEAGVQINPKIPPKNYPTLGAKFQFFTEDEYTDCDGNSHKNPYKNETLYFLDCVETIAITGYAKKEDIVKEDNDDDEIYYLQNGGKILKEYRPDSEVVYTATDKLEIIREGKLYKDDGGDKYYKITYEYKKGDTIGFLQSILNDFAEAGLSKLEEVNKDRGENEQITPQDIYNACSISHLIKSSEGKKSFYTRLSYKPGSDGYMAKFTFRGMKEPFSLGQLCSNSFIVKPLIRFNSLRFTKTGVTLKYSCGSAVVNDIGPKKTAGAQEESLNSQDEETVKKLQEKMSKINDNFDLEQSHVGDTGNVECDASLEALANGETLEENLKGSKELEAF